MDAPSSLSDPDRLAALERTGLVDRREGGGFDTLTALAAEAIGAATVLVSLVDEQRQTFAGQHGLPEPWAERRQTGLSHSFCQLVVRDRRPVVITDARSDPRVRENLAVDDLHVIAYAGVPLRDPDGQVLGSFCAIDTAAREWGSSELDTLERFATVAEQLLTRAASPVRPGDETSGSVEFRHLRRNLQLALLPHRVEGAPADRAETVYQPGSTRLLLGGDFVDVLEHADGSLGFIVGDVCGHGPNSAALALCLRSSWNAIEIERRPLPELTQRLNAIALRERRGSELLFATVVLGRLSPSGLRSELVAAGHPSPFLLGRPATEVSLAAGFPLGLEPNGTWEAHTLDVPRDGLLAYTDGLAEGRSWPGVGERWGSGRLLVAIEAHRARSPSLHGLCARLVRDATAAHGDELEDDVAVLWLRPTG